MRRVLVASATLWLTTLALPVAQSSPPPEAKAVAFLAKQVGARKGAQGCASCHHHGDAARALLMAANRGHDVGQAVADTRTFLQNPAGWAANKGHEADESLMRLQFAAALAAGGENDANPSPALVDAAKIILADQMPDGSWAPDASDPPNSPLTWGTAVATWMARSTLIASGREPDDFAVAQTDRWLRTVDVETVPDAAGVVLGLGVTSDAFDTALVVLALQQLESDPRLARSTYRVEELRAAIAKGRTWLIEAQRDDGSWPETMRGSATTSEAQRLSTTAWALMALLGGPK
jgi:hypothetical protein